MCVFCSLTNKLARGQNNKEFIASCSFIRCMITLAKESRPWKCFKSADLRFDIFLFRYPSPKPEEKQVAPKTSEVDFSFTQPSKNSSSGRRNGVEENYQLEDLDTPDYPDMPTSSLPSEDKEGSASHTKKESQA